MRILTLDNEPFELDHLPEEVDDMRFAIFDNSDPKDPDYHYIPLIFLESFTAPALVLRIVTMGFDKTGVDMCQTRELFGFLSHDAGSVQGLHVGGDPGGFGGGRVNF